MKLAVDTCYTWKAITLCGHRVEKGYIIIFIDNDVIPHCLDCAFKLAREAEREITK